MRAYSTDFRQKVVQAYKAGRGSQRALAGLFGVSWSFVQELLQRYRQTGSVAAKPQGGGPPSKVASHGAEIARLHREQPDASLAEGCEQFAKRTHVRVSRMTMSRAVARLALTREKRPFTPPSKIRRQSRKSGRPTGRTSSG
jgi:transposase